jgi:tRNA(Ile)-lysidine synthase TilS/MesJ
MAKRIKKEEPVEVVEKKNCDCKYPVLIKQITQSTDGHYFSWCSRCRLERRIELQELFS